MTKKELLKRLHQVQEDLTELEEAYKELLSTTCRANPIDAAWNNLGEAQEEIFKSLEISDLK
jgi:hypothetical protein